MHSNEQTDDANNVACGYTRDESRMITAILTVSLGLMAMIIVLSYALLAISKRQEMMLDEFLKRSGSMQETSVLINPETRSQAERLPNGRGN